MIHRIAAAAACAVVLAGCGVPAGSEGASNTSAQRSIQARWWEWAAAEAAATNPVSDATGEDCARNQPSDVWFLAGTFGGLVQRRCSVPLGVELVAPAINLVSGDPRDCTEFMAYVAGRIEFDGTAVPLQRFDGEPVAFSARPGNPVTGTSGKTAGTGCGLWALIDPPTAGEHTVHVHGESGTFTVDAEYELVVSATSRPSS